MPRAIPRAFQLTSLWLISSAATACGYDGRPQDIMAAHPQSLNVALAIQQAYQTDALLAPVQLPGGFGLRRAQTYLARLANALPAPKDRPVFSLLLVEPGLWSRYDEQLLVHSGVPGAEELVVITGEGPLLALAKTQLSFDQALEQGLIRIEGNEPGRQLLLNMLSEALASMAEQEA